MKEDLSIFGVVESLAWGAAAPTLGSALGGEVRTVVSSIKTESRHSGTFHPVAIKGDLDIDGGIQVPPELEAILGDTLPEVLARILEGTGEVLLAEVRVEVGAETVPVPDGRFTVTEVRLIQEERSFDLRFLLRPEAVEMIDKAYRQAESRETEVAVHPGEEVHEADHSPTAIRPVHWPPADDAPTEGAPAGLDLFYDVPLTVTAELGRVEERIEDVVALGPGTVVELDRMVGESVDLFVNGQWIAKGEVVVVEDNFGVRVTEIGSAQERAAKLRLRERS